VEEEEEEEVEEESYYWIPMGMSSHGLGGVGGSVGAGRLALVDQ